MCVCVRGAILVYSLRLVDRPHVPRVRAGFHFKRALNEFFCCVCGRLFRESCGTQRNYHYWRGMERDGTEWNKRRTSDENNLQNILVLFNHQRGVHTQASSTQPYVLPLDSLGLLTVRLLRFNEDVSPWRLLFALLQGHGENAPGVCENSSPSRRALHSKGEDFTMYFAWL